jgi:Actin
MLIFHHPDKKMAAFHGGDAVGAVVVDIGSATTKIGWAGDDYPKAIFRSVGATKALPFVLRPLPSVF